MSARSAFARFVCALTPRSFGHTHDTNAICVLSGNQRSAETPVPRFVAFIASPPSAARTKSCGSSSSAPSTFERRDVNAIQRPSGDHCGSASFGPFVTCRCVLPSVANSHSLDVDSFVSIE